MKNILSKKIFTVSELTFSIKENLEKDFYSIYVKGEVSNYKEHSSGHCYFSLKDENSQISAALFKMQKLKQKTKIKAGDKVVIYGDISVYPPRGSYQIIVKNIELLGVGELLLKLHQVKMKLKNKGYFEKEHKKPIPKFPKKIGVITSPTGSVIRDILNVLKRRFSNFQLLLNPVRVQGETAKEEIVKAIEDFNKYNLADVLIIARGGGSMEDLFSFNEEVVADAIFSSKIPIISAVGHETDHSISDYVADLRAATPSSAAEIVVEEKEKIIKAFSTYKREVLSLQKAIIYKKKNSLSFLLKNPIFSSSFTILARRSQKLDEHISLLKVYIKNILYTKRKALSSIKKQIFSIDPKNKILFLKEKLFSFMQKIEITIKNKIYFLKKSTEKVLNHKNLDNSILGFIDLKKELLKNLKTHVSAIDPKNLLKKGYSIIFSEKENSIILSSKNMYKDQKVYALFHDGKIKLKVLENGKK